MEISAYNQNKDTVNIKDKEVFNTEISASLPAMYNTKDTAVFMDYVK